jgi:hypothetical protein
MGVLTMYRKLHWLAAVVFLVSACTGGASQASPAYPSMPHPPEGWTTLGSVGGDQSSSGGAVIILSFHGRVAAVDAACSGAGTLDVIVGWPVGQGSSSAIEAPSALFTCGGDVSNPAVGRVILTATMTGDQAVIAFLVPTPNPGVSASYYVSVEEQDS